MFTILYELPIDRDPQLFIPFHQLHNTSSRLTYVHDDPSVLGDELRQQQKHFWAQILTPRYILVGGSLSTSRISNYSFESNNPCQWARQMGLYQTVPCPYFHPTIHEQVGARIQFKHQTVVEALLAHNQPLFDQFNFYYCKVTPFLSTRFRDWWFLMSVVISNKDTQICLCHVHPDNKKGATMSIGKQPSSSCFIFLVKNDV